MLRFAEVHRNKESRYIKATGNRPSPDIFPKVKLRAKHQKTVLISKITTMDGIPKYKIGDRVKIVNYGSLIWCDKDFLLEKSSFPLIKEDGNIQFFDIAPSLVGQVGVVDSVKITQGIPSYSIDDIRGKHAWYDEGQMEIAE